MCIRDRRRCGKNARYRYALVFDLDGGGTVSYTQLDVYKRQDYVTFPRDDIAKLSGLTMPVNKRNWRKQPVHLQGARAIQEINDKANGTNWREGNGRPKGSGTAQARVYEWRQQHPEGRKADCHRETGLDPKTVRKWWDCPPPAVRFENGHITVRVSPSQELSDWLLDALHDGVQE